MHQVRNQRFNIGTEASFASCADKIDAFYEKELKHHRIICTQDLYLSALELSPNQKGDGVSLQDSSRTLVIVAGRAETEHKYAELLYNLQDAKLRIIVCFVRGQGQSSPVISGSKKCHIDKFTDYLEDLKQILDYLKVGHNYRLMGFSLGGLISLSFAFYGNYEYKLGRLALMAPFLGTTFPVKDSILLNVIKPLCLIQPFALSYTPHGGEYKYVNFDDNVHSHSMIRYESYHDYYASHPQLPLGGPTFQFVRECLSMQKRLKQESLNFDFPAICIAAAADKIVDPLASKQFFKQHQEDSMPPVFEQIPNAYHDLINESDTYRNASLLRALSFLFD